MMIKKNKIIHVSRLFLAALLCLAPAGRACAQAARMSDDMAIGIPFGGDDQGPDYDICPQGARTVGMFLSAWGRQDYMMMYELIDDAGKEDYPYDEARLDFQLFEFKEYRISSIRQTGDDFEFILSSGDWRDGDKHMKKMIVSGRTYKIIMPRRGSFFKDSIADYF